MLEKLDRTALAATRALSVAGLIGLMVLAAMTLADGMMRWLANQPIEGVRDVGALVIALTVSCCIPVGLMERANVTVRFIGTVAGRRAGQAFDALASVLVEVVLILMAWEFWLYASKLARVSETTWILKLPSAPFWYAVDAILWIAVLAQGIVIALDAARLVGGEDSGSHAPTH